MADQVDYIKNLATSSLDSLERGVTTAGGVVWAEVLRSLVGILLKTVRLDKVGSGIFQNIFTALIVTIIAHFTMQWIKKQRETDKQA